MKLILCVLFSLIIITGSLMLFIVNSIIKELEGRISYFEYMINIKDQRM